MLAFVEGVDKGFPREPRNNSLCVLKYGRRFLPEGHNSSSWRLRRRARGVQISGGRPGPGCRGGACGAHESVSACLCTPTPKLLQQPAFLTVCHTFTQVAQGCARLCTRGWRPGTGCRGSACGTHVSVSSCLCILILKLLSQRAFLTVRHTFVVSGVERFSAVKGRATWHGLQRERLRRPCDGIIIPLHSDTKNPVAACITDCAPHLFRQRR
jgi:hypothetical protein